MTQQEYEQKRAECWEEASRRYGISLMNGTIHAAFNYAFSRAYALGKSQASCGQVKETITQEEIEKAAEESADCFLYGYRIDDILRDDLRVDMINLFKDAVDFALGKQFGNPEQLDADVVIQGWVARDQDGYISLFQDKPIRDTCDKDDIPYGFWADNTDHHIELPIGSFPDITWDDDPEPVEIIIKRKKNG